MDSDLKPCPFCGDTPTLHEIPPHTHVIATFMPDHTGSWSIECATCGAGQIRDTRDEVLTAWNLRTELATARAAGFADGVERMREIAAEMMATLTESDGFCSRVHPQSSQFATAIRALPVPHEGGEGS